MFLYCSVFYDGCRFAVAVTCYSMDALQPDGSFAYRFNTLVCVDVHIGLPGGYTLLQT